MIPARADSPVASTGLVTYTCPFVIPADFKASDSIDDCIASIIKGDTIYRILEYCVLTNRALASVRNHVNLGENDVS